jgi:hypothetical protein
MTRKEPPLNFKSPEPQIDLAEGPLSINNEPPFELCDDGNAEERTKADSALSHRRNWTPVIFWSSIVFFSTLFVLLAWIGTKSIVTFSKNEKFLGLRDTHLFLIAFVCLIFMIEIVLGNMWLFLRYKRLRA